jgi:hypothetical protein
MLFMVIEKFRKGEVKAVGERFRREGRMLPADVKYHASWVDAKGEQCFQIMEAPSEEALRVWMKRWEDLVEFEVVPVETSQEFWAKVRDE